MRVVQTWMTAPFLKTTVTENEAASETGCGFSFKRSLDLWFYLLANPPVQSFPH